MSVRLIILHLALLNLFFGCSSILRNSQDGKNTIATHKIIETYWKAANQRDWQTFKTLLHPDLVYILPQTRERIRGSASFCEFNASYPGDWKLETVRICAEESQAVSQILFCSNGGEQTGISFFKFKDGLIYHITEFWPVPYLPPTRQIKAIEQY